MSRGADGFEPLVTGDGSITFAHPVHAQTYHSRAGAWSEARVRYAQACRVRERALALRASGRNELRLLDVGTGLGLNLAAALEALADTGVVLVATSLEIDPRVLAATVAHGPQPVPELERVHAPVRAALAAALARLPTPLSALSALSAQPTSPAPLSARRDDLAPPSAQRDDLTPLSARQGSNAPHSSQRELTGPPTTCGPASAPQAPPKRAGELPPGGVGGERAPTETGVRVPLGMGHLDLWLGDGTLTLPTLPEAPSFDAVFLDPFSPAVEPDLWSPTFLVAVARRMAPGAYLSSYTASAAVRAALLAAGLAVGPLPAGLGKASGTLASRGGTVPAFDARTHAKLARRAARVAAEWTSGQAPA